MAGCASSDGPSWCLMAQDKTPEHIRLHERSFVEKPLLDRLKGLGWEIIDLEMKHIHDLSPLSPIKRV